MDSFSKSESKALRALASLAYERELSAALAQLQGQFDDWLAGKLSPFDLSDFIHKFHDSTARQLYTFYSGKPAPCVAYALTTGVLSEQEVSKDLASKLHDMVEFYRTEWPQAESRQPAV